MDLVKKSSYFSSKSFLILRDSFRSRVSLGKKEIFLQVWTEETTQATLNWGF